MSQNELVISALVVLTVAVCWAGFELYRLNAALQPIATSPLVTAVAGLGNRS